jgi:hypothetical protein
MGAAEVGGWGNQMCNKQSGVHVWRRMGHSKEDRGAGIVVWRNAPISCQEKWFEGVPGALGVTGGSEAG